MKKTMIKPVAYKQVLNTTENYKKKIKQDKKLFNDEVEQFIKNVSPFLTKKGTLKKGLSNKKVKQFNELITGQKEKKLNTLKGIKQVNKENINKKREKKFTEKWVKTEQDAKDVTTLLENKLTQRLMQKGYLDIYNLMDIAENEEVDEVDVNSVIDYALTELQNVTPDEIFDELKEDDDIQLFTEYKNSKAKEFMTRNMFYDWLTDNFEKLMKRRTFKGLKNVTMLTDTQLEQAYQDFLKGKFNRYM